MAEQKGTTKKSKNEKHKERAIEKAARLRKMMIGRGEAEVGGGISALFDWL
jgi:hypothetical protein